MDDTIKIFICADEDDLPSAKKLYDDLKLNGVSPWLEQEDLVPGAHIENTVKKAIRESDYFLALLSSKSVSKRGFIQKKLKNGMRSFEEFPDAEIFIIPVRIDECALPEALQPLTHVDMFPSYENCLNRIIAALGQKTPLEEVQGKSGANGGMEHADKAPNPLSGNDKMENKTNEVSEGPDGATDKTGGKNDLPQPMSSVAYAFVSLAAMGIGIGLLFLFIFKADDLISLGIGDKVYYVFERALEIFEQLAEENPDTYLPDLAGSLNNLGVFHRGRNDFESAQKAFERALAIFERLAEENPDTYLPYVAATQDKRGNFYQGRNDFESAQQAYKRALAIYERLADENPDTYLPCVARTLNNLGIFYLSREKIEKAETALSNALQIRKKLSTENPEVYEVDLCATYLNLAFLQKRVTEESPGKDSLQKGVIMVQNSIVILKRYPNVPEARKYLEICENLKKYFEGLSLEEQK